ncbi:hypothetical protein [Botrimarina sp.]|uniref:hypothetical protein n=1 Tax=Botrimarina sp. TaxID=2795802 RepID=UPI0032EF939C
MHALYRAIQIATLLAILGAAVAFLAGSLALPTAKAVMLTATVLWFAAPLLLLATGDAPGEEPLDEEARAPVA